MLSKEEYLYWKNKYDAEEELYNRGDEEELRRKFQENRYMTKEDLKRIVKWKFQGRLLGRQKRVLKMQEKFDDYYIKELSKLAFKIDDDKIRLKLLCCIDGVGNAMGSVILAFYDPDNYGVLDIHSWRGLFGEEPYDIFTNNKQATKFFNKLRKISKETGLQCRDIEKAIFKQDLDKSKKR